MVEVSKKNQYYPFYEKRVETHLSESTPRNCKNCRSCGLFNMFDGKKISEPVAFIHVDCDGISDIAGGKLSSCSEPIDTILHSAIPRILKMFSDTVVLSEFEIAIPPSFHGLGSK